MFSFDCFGDVDVGFHGFVVGVAGPFHDHLRRDAAGNGEADEGTTAGMGTYKLAFRASLFLALACAEVDAGDGVVDFAELTEFLQVEVHLLGGDVDVVSGDVGGPPARRNPAVSEG